VPRVVSDFSVVGISPDIPWPHIRRYGVSVALSFPAFERDLSGPMDRPRKPLLLLDKRQISPSSLRFRATTLRASEF